MEWENASTDEGINGFLFQVLLYEFVGFRIVISLLIPCLRLGKYFGMKRIMDHYTF